MMQPISSAGVDSFLTAGFFPVQMLVYNFSSCGFIICWELVMKMLVQSGALRDKRTLSKSQ